MTRAQQNIRSIVREMVQPTRHRTHLSVAQIADRIDVAPVTLYKWCEADGGHDIPAWKIPALTRATDDRLLLETLARECGCIVVPVPKSKRADVARVVKEFGEFLAEYGRVTKDGAVTDLEGKSLQREADDAIQAILYTVEEAKRASAGPWPKTRAAGAM